MHQWIRDHRVRVLLIGLMVALAAIMGLGWLLFVLVGELLANVGRLNSSPLSNPRVRWILVGQGVCAVFAIGAGWAVSLAMRAKGSQTHGTAHFATQGELKRAQLLVKPQRWEMSPRREGAQKQAATQSPPMLLPEARFVLGYMGRRVIALSERQQESHVLIVAPTGKRKSSGFFIPALLHERGRRSLVINDVKDELYRLCGGAMAESFEIWQFSPTRPERSTPYNPLAYLPTAKDVRDFARAWTVNTGLSSEGFYNVATENLITAVVFHLIDTAPAGTVPPLSSVAEMICTKTIEQLKELLQGSGSKRARDAANAFLEVLEYNLRLGSGILLGTANRFAWLLDSEDYRQVTASNTIDFARMIDGERAIALFISVPVSATDELRPLVASLLMQMMNYMTRRAEQSPDGRLPRSVAFMLDEFANAGRIPDIEKHITLVRSAGIAYIMAIQDFGQLSRVYDDKIKDTLLANATTQIALPGLGQVEAEYFSRRLGMTTVLARSTTRSRSRQRTGGGRYDQAGLLASGSAGYTRSETLSEVQRPLMRPEEIRQMPIGSFLMISDNHPPVRGVFKTYLERRELQERVNLPLPRTRVTEIHEDDDDQATTGDQERQAAEEAQQQPPPEKFSLEAQREAAAPEEASKSEQAAAPEEAQEKGEAAPEKIMVKKPEDL